MNKPASEETRRKISEGLKTYYASHTNALMGRELSDEIKEKRSEVSKRLWATPEYREARKNCRGWKLSEETRQKQSLANKGKWLNPEYREKQKNNNRSFTGHHHSDKARQKISQDSRLRWQDPAYRDRVMQSQTNTDRGIHTRGVMKTLEALVQKGFRCIPLIQAPIPDIIAIKDGSVFAVEYETGLKRADLGKYTQLSHCFDDVIWVMRDDFSKLEKAS